MSSARLISTLYIIELKDRGWEYHLTLSSDLKSIYDIDVLERGEGKERCETELLDIIKDLFFQSKLNLDE